MNEMTLALMRAVQQYLDDATVPQTNRYSRMGERLFFIDALGEVHELKDDAT